MSESDGVADAVADSVARNVAWLSRLLPDPAGARGIFERFTIDSNEMVDRVRPDCTAESQHTFRHVAAGRGSGVAAAMLGHLLSLQRDDGAFPFYERTPSASGWQTDTAGSLYPNDNGKTLEMLVYAHRDEPVLVPLERIRRAADYLAAGQDAAGRFLREDGSFAGPCYVAWPVVGLARAYTVTGDERHRASARLGARWLADQQLADGRLRTSFELTGAEAWRPASSETAEALRAFALAHRLLDEDLGRQIGAAAGFLERLSADSGAVRNCDSTCLGAALQNDPHLTDLVYTDGYALHAWLDAWRATGDSRHLRAARALASFLMGIQTSDDSVPWNGAWRGSYDIDARQWRGRANQRNPLDEGGAYSVYTGWCNATISNGLLRVASAESTSRRR